MAFVKLDQSNTVIQKQPYAEEGFEEVPDDVVCGQIKQANGTFSNPAPVPKTAEELLRDALAPTEDIGAVARKVEDIIDHLVNGTPLAQFAKDWAAGRKALR